MMADKEFRFAFCAPVTIRCPLPLGKGSKKKSSFFSLSPLLGEDEEHDK
jgi:hypothetical protein